MISFFYSKNTLFLSEILYPKAKIIFRFVSILHGIPFSIRVIVMGDIPADKAPTFYIDIDDVNVSEVKYEIPLIYWEDVIYPAGAGLRSSGLISSQNWNNFPVAIDPTVWKNLKVEDDYVDIIITITDQAGNSYNTTFAVYRAALEEDTPGKGEYLHNCFPGWKKAVLHWL